MEKNTPPSASCTPQKLRKPTKEDATASPKQGRLSRFIRFVSSKFRKSPPEKNTSPLFELEEKITGKWQQNLLVKAYARDVLFWSGVVYGDKYVLLKEIEKILENPDVGDAILWKISNFPEAIHPLAGKKLLGIKNPTRKKAERHCESLCVAMKAYKNAVERAEYFPFSKSEHHKQFMEKIKQTECLEKPRHTKKEIVSHVNKKTPLPQKNKKVSWNKSSTREQSCSR